MLRELFLGFLPDRAEQLLMSVGAALGILVHVLFGDVVVDVLCLFILVAVDYVLGTTVAYKQRWWSSRQSFFGTTKKVWYFIIIALAHTADMALNSDDISLRAIAVGMYTVTEFGSILENIELLGYGRYIPPMLRKAMKVVEERRMGRLSEGLFEDGNESSETVGRGKGKDADPKV